MNLLIILLQNSTSLTNNKKHSKKLVAPAIELGKHNVPVDSKGSDEGSYFFTQRNHLSKDYYLSMSSGEAFEESETVIITNVNVNVASIEMTLSQN